MFLSKIKTTLRLQLLAYLLFLGLPALAQPISYSALYDNSTFPRTIDLSRPVGATEGQAGTGPSGAVTYSIPVKCPPGSHGMAPKISIEYNSQGSNGILGKGWSISGLSAIVRVGRDVYHSSKPEPISYTNADGFVLDGSYLIGRTGSYGVSGATYQTETESYSVITSSGSIGGGPGYFIMKTKDGTIMEYGNDPTARLMTDDGAVVMMWRINKIQDVSGNYMTFTYDNTDRDSRITKISYTGNTAAAVSPYNEINFNYAIRSDVNTSYNSGFTTQSKYLLNQIEIKGEGDVFKLYQFNYGLNKGISYLKNVQEFEHAGGASLNDTRFQYGTATNDFSIGGDAHAFGTITSQASIGTGDFDGDGLADFVVSDIATAPDGTQSATVNIRKRTAADATYVTTASLSFDATATFENSHYGQVFAPFPSDINGDGRDDIVISHSSYTGGARSLDWIKVYYCNSSGGIAAAPDYTYTPPGIYNVIHKGANDVQNYFYVGDFNGDGRSDFITILRGQLFFNSPAAGITDKTGTFPGGYTVSGLFDDADGVYVVNMDGDSKSDLMIVQDGTTRIFTFNFNAAMYDLHIDQIGTDMSAPTSNDVILFGDFNGDGKTDLLTGPQMSHSPSNAWNVSYSTGNSFQSTPFNFNHVIRMVFDPNDPYVTAVDEIRIGDFNGDGMSDIFDFNHDIPANCYMYTSTGRNFASTLTTTTAFYSIAKALADDINGDGKADIIINYAGFVHNFL